MSGCCAHPFLVAQIEIHKNNNNQSLVSNFNSVRLLTATRFQQANKQQFIFFFFYFFAVYISVQLERHRCRCCMMQIFEHAEYQNQSEKSFIDIIIIEVMRKIIRGDVCITISSSTIHTYSAICAFVYFATNANDCAIPK